MDYQLFPIRKSDLDKTVYLLVKAAVLTHSVEVTSAYYHEFPEEAALGLKQLFFNHVEQRCYLVFPSRHRQFRLFPSEVTQHRALIAVYQKDGHGLSGFYTLDSLQVGLCWHDWRLADVPAPVFHNNTYELHQAMRQVTQMLEARGVASSEWYGRLLSAKHILESGGDKMHILHNGGLYDHASLRLFLQQRGLADAQVEEVLDGWLSQLEQYAMYAVSVSRLIDRRANYIYRKE